MPPLFAPAPGGHRTGTVSCRTAPGSPRGDALGIQRTASGHGWAQRSLPLLPSILCLISLSLSVSAGPGWDTGLPCPSLPSPSLPCPSMPRMIPLPWDPSHLVGAPRAPALLWGCKPLDFAPNDFGIAPHIAPLPPKVWGRSVIPSPPCCLSVCLSCPAAGQRPAPSPGTADTPCWTWRMPQMPQNHRR